MVFGFFGLVLAQVITWLQREASPLLSAALTVVAGSIPLVIEYLKARHPPPPPSEEGRPSAAGRQTVSPRRSTTGLAAGLLVLGLLAAVAYGATSLVGAVTGWEPRAVQRLVEPVMGKAGALRVEVDDVKAGRRYTQVRLTATNAAAFPVTIPLFDNCQLVEPGRVTLEAKTGVTTSAINVPPDSVPITKDVVFVGAPARSATSLSLVCNHLFWQGFGQPGSLQVKGIRLHPHG